jgi:hypothetical protein
MDRSLADQSLLMKGRYGSKSAGLELNGGQCRGGKESCPREAMQISAHIIDTSLH